MLNKTITFLPHIMFQEFDNEAVLLNVQTQEHFGLDPISSLFIKNVLKNLSIQEIEKIITNEYNVTKEQLSKDLNSLITTLLENKLIEVS